jgi:hypothetical protein
VTLINIIELTDRIIESPGNLLEKLSLCMPTSVDEFLPSEHYAHPITLGIHAVQFLCIVPFWRHDDARGSILRGAPDRSVGGRWGQWEEQHTSRRWGWSVSPHIR